MDISLKVLNRYVKVDDQDPKELADKIEEIGVGEIATVSGRYYAMDRDKRFDRVELAFDAIVNHKGESFECPVQYVKDSYAKETYDEFVIPGYNKNVDGQVADGDSVIFANFRPDRAIQLATVMTNDGFYDHAFNNVPSEAARSASFLFPAPRWMEITAFVPIAKPTVIAIIKF